MFGVYFRIFSDPNIIRTMWRLRSISVLIDEETRKCSKSQKSEPRFKRSINGYLFLGVARHLFFGVARRPCE